MKKIKNDFLVAALKRIAQNGSEKGTYYDLGVLSVIEQIEIDGAFVPCRWLLINAIHHHPELRACFTQSEISEAMEYVASRNWTLDQAAEYVSGVGFAESILSRFRTGHRD